MIQVYFVIFHVHQKMGCLSQVMFSIQYRGLFDFQPSYLTSGLFCWLTMSHTHTLDNACIIIMIMNYKYIYIWLVNAGIPIADLIIKKNGQLHWEYLNSGTFFVIVIGEMMINHWTEGYQIFRQPAKKQQSECIATSFVEGNDSPNARMMSQRDTSSSVFTFAFSRGPTSIEFFFQDVTTHMEITSNYGYPQIIHFSRIFHYTPSIWGYPHSKNPPY